MSTVQTLIINPALRLANIIGAEETPSNAEAQDALRTLNRLIDQWAADSLKIPVITAKTFTLSASTTSFTVGSGGNIDITRPEWLHRVQYRDSNSYDTELTPLTLQAWMGVHDKTQTAARPSSWFYDPTYASSLGTLYLWPIADTAATGVVWYPASLSEFAAVTTTLTVPHAWENFMVTQLAKKLSGGYGRQLSPLIMEDAMEAEQTLQRQHLRMMDMSVDAGALTGRGSAGYSIETDS
jgi:hypothetical protein